MNSAADYIAAVLLLLLVIALFLNVKNGTVVDWLRSKFLGVAPGQSATSFFTTPAKAA